MECQLYEKLHEYDYVIYLIVFLIRYSRFLVFLEYSNDGIQWEKVRGVKKKQCNMQIVKEKAPFLMSTDHLANNFCSLLAEAHTHFFNSETALSVECFHSFFYKPMIMTHTCWMGMCEVVFQLNTCNQREQEYTAHVAPAVSSFLCICHYLNIIHG